MVLDFDAFRESYDRLTPQELAEFYDVLHAEYPDQAYFSPHLSEEFFDKVISEDRYAIVSEIGGYDGSAALSVLAKFPEIVCWYNFEPSSAKETGDPDPRYVRWPIFATSATVMYASHVLEHMKKDEIDALLRVFPGKWLFIETPLEEKPTDWTGQTCGHVLEIGWEGLAQLIEGYGWREFMRRTGERTGMDNTVRAYRREDS